jgi:hypothetical protein
MDPLAPGTRVIALVASTTACAVAAAIVCLTVTAWRIRIAGRGSWAVLLMAASVGVGLSRVLASLAFLAPVARVRVVPVGFGAVPFTIAGAVIAGVTVCGTLLLATRWIEPRAWMATGAVAGGSAAVVVALCAALL